MSNKTEIFIDVGPHKTGSTFRQRILYPNIKEINYYEERDALELLMFNNFKKNGKILISNENLSGWSYLPNHDALSERENAANNLKKLFPNANIIVCLREKKTWIKSLYKQYVWSGGMLNYYKWYNRINEQVFDLDNYVKYLEERFDNICILQFENMKKDINDFVKKINDFLGVTNSNFKNKSLNVSLSNNQIKLFRILNHLWKTDENPYGLPFFRHWRHFLYKISVKDKT